MPDVLFELFMSVCTAHMLSVYYVCLDRCVIEILDFSLAVVACGSTSVIVLDLDLLHTFDGTPNCADSRTE